MQGNEEAVTIAIREQMNLFDKVVSELVHVNANRISIKVVKKTISGYHKA